MSKMEFDGEQSERSGFRLELRGGPLSGGMARVLDTEVRLMVVRENGRLRMQSDVDPDEPASEPARVVGAYGFSHREEALVWFPAV